MFNAGFENVYQLIRFWHQLATGTMLVTKPKRNLTR